MATDYTDGLALRAMKLIFKYLPGAYDNGQTDVKAQERVSERRYLMQKSDLLEQTSSYLYQR